MATGGNDPFSTSNNRNLLQRIFSPKIVTSASGFVPKLDMINVDNIYLTGTAYKNTFPMVTYNVQNVSPSQTSSDLNNFFGVNYLANVSFTQTPSTIYLLLQRENGTQPAGSFVNVVAPNLGPPNQLIVGTISGGVFQPVGVITDTKLHTFVCVDGNNRWVFN
jgi:hypothetical protein